MAPPGIEPGLNQCQCVQLAPPGIEPGLNQNKCVQMYLTTMIRHTTRPWHLFDVPWYSCSLYIEGLMI
ncbi:hypothetical protein N7472_007605 [Penicillium cf. griseofulvum]|uniref:Uncharacterized protein n=1 Tax=Penicillium cf. griseofulvum TaxID=2972120 RepID=A0A9W9M3S0_9EURO|nr:hypothetical protein N7472_007605 [Penicillium cf. griseofulvum]